MSEHVLKRLVLPDRYERLVDHLGVEVANLLTAPDEENVESLRALANEVYSRREGVLVPVSGRTGIGKTTFVMNASQWQPALFAPALQYNDDLEFDKLVRAVREHAAALNADETRIIPLNIDHRENAPPTDAELSTIKRFLRTSAGGVPSIIFWPETSESIAKVIANRYVDIAGKAAVELPLECKGPARPSWREIAKHTLSLSNHIQDLETLGVDPEDYDVDKYRTLGEFLRQISHDFNKKVDQLRRDLERPVSIIIAFCSESTSPGVLTEMTSPRHYGVLDSHALISITAQSQVGKWWSARRGLLTRAIVQLDARAVCVTPTATASVIRNFSDSMKLFDDVKYHRYGPARGARDLARSDLGKLIKGTDISRFESRGSPGGEGLAAFQLLAEAGFNLGRDKSLNGLMLKGMNFLLSDDETAPESSTSEKKLSFCGLIPDNAIYYADRVQCVEYTWRKGEFLATGNRSTVAQYVLSKLQDYVRQLGWTSD